MVTGREAFTVIVRGFGAYFIYHFLMGAVGLLTVACGFDLHYRNAPAADTFAYLCYLLIGAALIAWADRLAGLVYRREIAAPEQSTPAAPE